MAFQVASSFLKYLRVALRPSSSGVVGRHPNSARALLMSGCRCFGSSPGCSPAAAANNSSIRSVLTAFLLFGLLDGIRIAFNPVSSEAGSLRMFTVARFSVHGLPQSLSARFTNVSGVRQVTWASFLGGHFQDPRNTFATYAVDRHVFNLYPDYALANDQRRTFEDTRTGAIAGEALARRFNWKVGDRIPLRDAHESELLGDADT